MKKKTKVIVSSALSIALCASMISGATFALFTDEAQTNIAVTAGTVDVHAAISDLKLTTSLDADYSSTTEFQNKGTASFNEEKTALTLTHVTPGDIANFNIDVENNSNVDIKYRVVAEVSGDLAKYLVIKADGQTLVSNVGGWVLNTVANEDDDKFTIPMMVELPAEVNSDAAGLIANVTIKLEAVQANGAALYDAEVFVYNAEELKAALEAGENVGLMDDVTVTETLTIAKDQDVVLSLNGHSLNYAVDNDGKAAAIISNKGNLEIVGEGNISFVAKNPDLGEIPAYATNTITNTGKLTIGEGVVVHNGSDGSASYAVDNHGEFILDGGTLTAKHCALRVAKYNQDNVVFTMNSGSIIAATPVWIQLPGSDSSVAPKITVTINDGLIQTTKESSEDNNIFYTYSYGNSHANTSITINGGNFIGGTVSIGSGYKGDAPTWTINGGNFEYDVLQWTSGDSVVLKKSNATVVGTSEAVKAALANTSDGVTIFLKAGTYDDLSFVNPANYKAKNVTIIGEEGTIVSGLAFHGEEGGSGWRCDVDGLTIKNVTFSQNILFGSVEQKNVLIENCTFTDNACINQNNNIENITNLTVKDCKFTGSGEGTTTALMLENVTNLFVTGCTFTDIQFNVLQCGKMSGTVLFDGNTINATGDRVFRFVTVNADVTISNNTITSDGDDSGELAKASSACEITLSGNTWNTFTDAEIVDKLVNITAK